MTSLVGWWSHKCVQCKLACGGTSKWCQEVRGATGDPGVELFAQPRSGWAWPLALSELLLLLFLPGIQVLKIGYNNREPKPACSAAAVGALLYCLILSVWVRCRHSPVIDCQPRATVLAIPSHARQLSKTKVLKWHNWKDKSS